MKIPLKYKYLTNEYVEAVIDSFIRSERDRGLLKRHLLDGIPFEPLAEEFGISPVTAKRTISKEAPIVFSVLETGSPPPFYSIMQKMIRK